MQVLYMDLLAMFSMLYPYINRHVTRPLKNIISISREHSPNLYLTHVPLFIYSSLNIEVPIPSVIWYSKFRLKE